MVARTPAAVSRLWDVLPLVSEDPRIQVTFAVDHGSVFSPAVDTRLREAGALILPWTDAVHVPFDLAVAASDNGGLHQLRAPLLLLPHGAGYHRYSAAEPGAISGVRRSTLIHDGSPVPHTLVVAHPGQVERVRQVDSTLADRTLVAGDPCLDRITASRPQRRRYRRAFAAESRVLVVLCSTWGPQSLFGRLPDLPRRVTAALPVDEYRVALVLHPNVWQHHGSLQVRSWLRTAVDAGLAVIPPEEGWRAALVAADLVISDHGSLTCYAVAASTPTLIAADGGPEVVPDSPLRLLLQRLPALRHGEPFDEQVDAAVARGAVARDVVDGMFAEQGAAAKALRERMYRILELAEPPWRAPTYAVPVPAPAIPRPEALQVAVRTAVHQADRLVLTLERRPATWEDWPEADHLTVCEAILEPGLLERASVIWNDDTYDTAESAQQWARTVLRAYPGARVAITGTTEGTLIASIRGAGYVTAQGISPRCVAGSAIYRWSLLPGKVKPTTIQVGTRTLRLEHFAPQHG
ncbi:hypothetical protein [Amycolatopsis nigrescens]|uniref:hypothetical protein n=1 Tax=Amycolatopsis nigrescens TaxID=381445 RepID=UPI00037805F6|nr:hypothetical protein [Amycolatopsis nigrescens]